MSLHHRAIVARAIAARAMRATLDARGYLEVHSPLLAPSGCPDAHIESFRCGDRYLATSTEYQLKRLMTRGHTALYTLTQNFRLGDLGPTHNPEFTMLEWCRRDASLSAIEDEAIALLHAAAAALTAAGLPLDAACVELLSRAPVRRSVADCINRALGTRVDERWSEASVLQACRASRVASESELQGPLGQDQRALISLLLVEASPHIGFDAPTFVVDWPSVLTSSAPRLEGNPAVAQRSELMVRGLELADGFPFLRNARTQRRLFGEENAERRRLGLREVDLDERFLAELPDLPAGAGMALGFDRALMFLLGAPTLSEVLVFGWESV